MTLRPIRRAILSVFDKAGLVDFGRGLDRHGVMLISTGGSAKARATRLKSPTSPTSPAFLR